MRRPGPLGADPDSDETLLERLRAAASGLFGRLGGDSPQQALPLSRYRGQTGPVVPYHERRQLLLRSRRRQHSSYALVFIVVLLVLVVGLFYGLTWALGGLSLGGGSRQATTAPVKPTVPSVLSSPSVPVPVLSTAAPGGSAPSPSPAPVETSPGGTPQGRTYTVKAGDTPGQIAREFSVSVEALMRANNISDARALRVGDRLVIPPEATPTPPR